jgi:hypothetical protein
MQNLVSCWMEEPVFRTLGKGVEGQMWDEEI